MPPQQIEADITNTFERFFTLGANIDHSESRSLTGVSLIKIYFKPGTDPNAALSNIANLAMADLRRLPPGTLTPVVLGMDASSQPVCLLTLKGQGLNERREAEKAIVALRSSINVDLGTPQTVCDLAAHYRAHELTQDKKSFSTIDNHRHLFKRYIEPRWGNLRLGAVRTMEVEEWLHSLSLAPSSKAKLKCVLSTLYHHAIRYEWLTFNPISRVRTSQMRLRDKDVLTPEEFQKLVQQLCVRDRAMVLLIGSTGLRRSEMIALTWSDLNMRTMEVNVLRSCVRNRIGKTKDRGVLPPVPLQPLVLNACRSGTSNRPMPLIWISSSPLCGSKGPSPSALTASWKRAFVPRWHGLESSGKESAGTASAIHSRRISGRSVSKVAQELMRHSSCRTALDGYTRAVGQQKARSEPKSHWHDAVKEMKKFQHPSAPSMELEAATLVSGN